MPKYKIARKKVWKTKTDFHTKRNLLLSLEYRLIISGRHQQVITLCNKVFHFCSFCFFRQSHSLRQSDLYIISNFFRFIHDRVASLFNWIEKRQEEIMFLFVVKVNIKVVLFFNKKLILLKNTISVNIFNGFFHIKRIKLLSLCADIFIKCIACKRSFVPGWWCHFSPIFIFAKNNGHKVFRSAKLLDFCKKKWHQKKGKLIRVTLKIVIRQT